MDFDKAMNRKDDEDIATAEAETEGPYGSQEDWAAETENISIANLDKLVMTYVSDRKAYEEAKAESNELDAVCKQSKDRLIKMLIMAGKKKYDVDGIGSVTVSQELKVRVPDSMENKVSMFEWIRKNEGEAALNAYATIHHGTLQTFYTNMKEKYGAAWHMPGLEMPSMENKLTFRGSKH